MTYLPWLAAALALPASAYRVIDGPVKTAGPIPAIMDGYDVMGFWEAGGGRSVKGNPAINATVVSKDRDGTERAYAAYFASEAAKANFTSNVDKFMPQYGGFCAWGACCELPPQWPWSAEWLGPPAGVDEKNKGWRVVDGKLYFAIWTSYVDKFFERPENVRLGDERWAGWFGSATEGVVNVGCFATGTYCTDRPQEKAPALL